MICELLFGLEKCRPLCWKEKFGKDYARHRALNNILDCSEYNIPESVVLCNDNYARKDKVTYAPIYMVMFIHKDPVIDVTFRLDLSGL